jgi:hypothetical protein
MLIFHVVLRERSVPEAQKKGKIGELMLRALLRKFSARFLSAAGFTVAIFAQHLELFRSKRNVVFD